MTKPFERWLKQSKRDLESAELLARNGFHEQACYLCQQSAEKLGKALFVALGVFRGGQLRQSLGHELPVIFRAWEMFRDQLPPRATHITLLNRYQMATRYPDEEGIEGAPADKFLEEHSNDALVAARELAAFFDPRIRAAEADWTAARVRPP